jgi:hypothetical protein
MNRLDIAHQVSTTLGDHADDYDIDAIVNDLIDSHDGELNSVDDIDGDTYWAIVEKHDTIARDDADTGFTAWLTTQANMTDNGEYCEINVTEDEATGGPEPMPATQLAVAAEVNTEDETAQRAAEAELEKAGWETVGDWEQYDHGYTIAVRRA